MDIPIRSFATYKDTYKYIDYKKSNLIPSKEELPEVLRLIITSVDVMTSKPLIFDNTKMEIKAKHILGSSGYPIYGFPWIEVEKGVFGWDGSLLSNTPVPRNTFCISSK